MRHGRANALVFFLAVTIAAPPGEARAQAARYVGGEVARSGSIAGRVTFEGPAPKLELDVTQDHAVCQHEGGKTPSPRLKVGEKGGVAETVVFIREIAAGKPMEELVAALTLDQKGCAYKPFVQVAPFAGTLKIVNSDRLNHNVNGKFEGNRQLFNYAMPNASWPRKQTISKRLTRPGLVTVQCDIHMWMSAYIWVVRHPYYAVTGEDGRFELTDVPPGEYELVAWHPSWEGQRKQLFTGQLGAYAWGDPIEKSVKVTVTEGAAATADFVINK